MQLEAITKRFLNWISYWWLGGLVVLFRVTKEVSKLVIVIIIIISYWWLRLLVIGGWVGWLCYLELGAGPMSSFGVKEPDRTVLGKNRRGPGIEPWGTPVFT